MQKKEEPIKKPVNYIPNQKQYQFHMASEVEVVYGGAKGGGKSAALVIDATAYAAEYPGAEVYLFRETYDDLEANLIAEFNKRIPVELLAKPYNETKHQATLVNGSTIKFRFVKNYQDAMGYHGRSIDYMGIDELTKHDERTVQNLLSCMRSAKGFPVKFRGTCNPGDIGHAWVKKRYITATKYGQEATIDPDTGNTIAFIPATVYDNTVLMQNDPAYVRRLENLPEDQKKAFLYGDWDVYEGMAFEKFSHKMHVVDPFPIPRHWRKWMSADNGFTDPFAWYWFAVDETGTVYIYDEFTRDYDDPKLTYTQQAERIVEMISTEEWDEDSNDYLLKPEKFHMVVLGHDAFAKSHETGKTLEDYYRQGGLKQPFIKAVTDRRIRKATWIEYLEPRDTGKVDEDGTTIIQPKLKIFSHCKKLIETIPLQINDERDPEKVALTDYDHWYDGAGYGLVAHHLDGSRPVEKQLTIIEQHKKKLMKGSKDNRRIS